MGNKCPLLLGLVTKGSIEVGTCLERECSWWEELYGRCSVVLAMEAIMKNNKPTEVRKAPDLLNMKAPI